MLNDTLQKSGSIPLSDREISIWPSVAPGSENLSIKENVVNRALDRARTFDRTITQVLTPTVTPFFPSHPNGTSVIICPGGSYVSLAYDNEGRDCALMFNQLGITAFVLKYRLPCDGHANKQNVALADLQRAMRYVKYHASSWGLDASKTGVMGSSAGGHLAASLAADYRKSVYVPVDEIDTMSAQAAFSLFLYPLISMEPALRHKQSTISLLGTLDLPQSLIDEFSLDKCVCEVSSPAFIAVASDDDVVNFNNSVVYADALRSHGIKVSLHVYKNGGHGKGFSKVAGTDFARWIGDCKLWLTTMKLSSC